ncbi:hypothetical protein BDV18DRAFT_96756 [Aspergillus unguis]
MRATLPLTQVYFSSTTLKMMMRMSMRVWEAPAWMEVIPKRMREDQTGVGLGISGVGILPGLLRRKPDMKEDIARLGRGGLINETEKSAYNPDNESDINDGFTGSDEDDEDESDDDDEEEAGTQTGVMSQYAMNQYQMGIERRAAASPHSTSQPGARGVGASQRSASMGGAGGNTTGAVTNADSDITMEDRFELPGSAGNSNGGTNRQLSK